MSSKTEFQLMLMMLALRFAEFVLCLGRTATLLCIQRSGDGSVSSTPEFQLMLMMLALRFADFVQ